MEAGQECAAMNDLLKEPRNQRAYTIQNDLLTGGIPGFAFASFPRTPNPPPNNNLKC
ncbi:hypothetical protein KIN20_009738 [Parelaphostrongylus tenuis]|uniref:Uncharacterized protein n=1 Tax=Parelaphostrongylus tenuis TaxID=148309 RepID=A0AAD5M8K9_PARTN|nr:hypothetical protein KIN20_009738 [Parelaphostrongylus tenuis]